jgi:hypothetical protein
MDQFRGMYHLRKLAAMQKLWPISQSFVPFSHTRGFAARGAAGRIGLVGLANKGDRSIKRFSFYG